MAPGPGVGNSQFARDAHVHRPEARRTRITLPTPKPPVANYVPVVRTGNLLFVSGQVSVDGSGSVTTGKLGAGMSIEDGRAAARLCAINVLAQIKAVTGDLGAVVRVVKLVAS